MLERDAQPKRDPNNINCHYSAVVLSKNSCQTKSSGTCGTLVAEIIEVDSDSGDIEIVDSQPIPVKSVQNKSACNTPRSSIHSNIPACHADKLNHTPLGESTNTRYNAKSSKEKFHLNYNLYHNSIRVAYLPHDINGNKNMSLNVMK